jgi:hypothetical protein
MLVAGPDVPSARTTCPQRPGPVARRPGTATASHAPGIGPKPVQGPLPIVMGGCRVAAMSGPYRRLTVQPSGGLTGASYGGGGRQALT